ncbi:hypothetical protein [Cytobacillus oceanisediminis]|uniref:hypothetical protein n=1 Tax=Cytobacillus oceanisediminis TaxID=665099 RepID=UPI001FB39500|nr:hypothetical protein [Cytobacillus oceanisediminis]UOE58044.1 hypothetical protein IRB79_27660 [Cytobacillus oceanisediminis]
METGYKFGRKGGAIFMKTFLISYIEDNHLGVYPKEILVEAPNFVTCFREYIVKYPTMYGIKEMFGEIEERWKNYYTHESQDLLRESQLKTGKDIDEMFLEEERV